MPLEATTSRSNASLPPALRAFALAALALTLLCLGTEFVCAHFLHLNFIPYDGLTFAPQYKYWDAIAFNTRFHHFHQPDFFSPAWGDSFLYPAPNAFFYRFFTLLPHSTACFLATIVLLCALCALWLERALERRGLARPQASLFAAIAFLTSYPAYFVYNRGNVEIFIWLLCAAGIFAFLRDRPWLAATLIACAAACKGYPFIYLGLLFARKQYLQTAYSVVLGMAINFFSLWAIAGNFTIGKNGVAAGVEQFRQIYILHSRFGEIGLDHSFFGQIKRLWPNLPPPDQLAHALTIYLATAAVAGCVLYFLRAWRLPVTNQIIFLSVAAITLPPTSYDYTLLHLYTGWVLLVFLAVSAWRNGHPLPSGFAPAMVCYVLLLAPLSEFILHGERLEGLLKCIVLVTLAFISLRFPLPLEPAPVAAEV